MKKIVLNQIQTPDGTILRSHHVHDYVTYIDKNGKEYMVDGGTEYLRRTIHQDAPYIELTIFDDAPFEVIRESLHRGGRGKDGDKPLTFVPISKMSDNWLKNCIKYNKQIGQEKSYHSKMYTKELIYRKKNKITIED